MIHYYAIKTTPRALLDGNIKMNDAAALLQVLETSDLIFLEPNSEFRPTTFADFKALMQTRLIPLSDDTVDIQYAENSRLTGKNAVEVLLMYREELDNVLFSYLDWEVMFMPLSLGKFHHDPDDCSPGCLAFAHYECVDDRVQCYVATLEKKFNIYPCTGHVVF